MTTKGSPTGAGTRSKASGRSRQLEAQSSKPKTFLILDGPFSAHDIYAELLPLHTRSRPKVSYRRIKGGYVIRTEEADNFPVGIQILKHDRILLPFDQRSGAYIRLASLRSLPPRVTFIIDSALTPYVKRMRMKCLDSPSLPPAPVSIQLIPFERGDRSRVILTFRNMFEVHQALRTTFELGPEDDFDLIIPDLWLDPDHFSPQNF